MGCFLLGFFFYCKICFVHILKFYSTTDKPSFTIRGYPSSRLGIAIVLSQIHFYRNNSSGWFGAPQTVWERKVCIYIIHNFFFSMFVPLCFRACSICCSWRHWSWIWLVSVSAAEIRFTEILVMGVAKFAQKFVVFICIQLFDGNFHTTLTNTISWSCYLF